MEDAKSTIIASARQRLVAASADLYNSDAHQPAGHEPSGGAGGPAGVLPGVKQPPLAELLGLNSPWGHDDGTDNSSGGSSSSSSSKKQGSGGKKAASGTVSNVASPTEMMDLPRLVVSDVLHQATGGGMGMQWIVSARITNLCTLPVSLELSLVGSAAMVGTTLESTCFGGGDGSSAQSAQNVPAGATTTVRAVATISVAQMPVGKTPAQVAALLHCRVLPLSGSSTAPTAAAIPGRDGGVHYYHLGWFALSNEMVLNGKAAHFKTGDAPETPTSTPPSSTEWLNSEAPSLSKTSSNIPLCGYSACLTVTAADPPAAGVDTRSANESLERALSLLRFVQQPPLPPPQQQQQLQERWVGGPSVPAMLRGVVATVTSDVQQKLRCTLRIYADKQQQVAATLAAVGSHVPYGLTFAPNTTPPLANVLYNTAAVFARIRSAAASASARGGDRGAGEEKATATTVLSVCKVVGSVQADAGF